MEKTDFKLTKPSIEVKDKNFKRIKATKKFIKAFPKLYDSRNKLISKNTKKEVR